VERRLAVRRRQTLGVSARVDRKRARPLVVAVLEGNARNAEMGQRERLDVPACRGCLERVLAALSRLGERPLRERQQTVAVQRERPRRRRFFIAVHRRGDERPPGRELAGDDPQSPRLRGKLDGVPIVADVPEEARRREQRASLRYQPIEPVRAVSGRQRPPC
jgi:hypothetical protein